MEPVQEPITGAEYRDGDAATPRGVLTQFYAAFNACDLELMAANWYTGADAVMSNPLGGIARGWPAIRAVYEQIFAGPARVRVEFYDYTLHEGAELFVAVGRERGTLEHEGRELPLAIRTTRVFRRSGEAWRQIHHHGSMDDAALLQRYQTFVNSPRRSIP
jgi:ketosteroid isomerase-like protein